MYLINVVQFLIEILKLIIYVEKACIGFVSNATLLKLNK